MKKIINKTADVEQQMIEGMVKAYPQHVKKLDCGNVVVRANKKTDKVALVSGGGSGHEPAHDGQCDALWIQLYPGHKAGGERAATANFTGIFEDLCRSAAGGKCRNGFAEYGPAGAESGP